jgi:hypothetical protein
MLKVRDPFDKFVRMIQVVVTRVAQALVPK